MSRSSPDIVQWMLLGETVSATEPRCPDAQMPGSAAVCRNVLLSCVEMKGLWNSAKTQSPIPKRDNIMLLTDETSCMLFMRYRKAAA